jgi:hypothetical protein
MIKQITAINLFGAFLILFSVASMVACKGDSSKKLDNQAPTDTDMEASVDVNILSGKVKETMNSGGYTYVLLDKEGKKTWAAVPEMQVSQGEDITLKPGIEMTNFTSRTLSRTFKRIILSPGPVSEKGEPVEKNMEMPHGDLSMGMMETPVGGGMGISTKIGDVKVEKAAGQDAYTVAEVYEKKSDLSNNKVIVRGKVIKVLPEILGKNWIHLQDGSGDEKRGNYDLVVTSQDLPSVGDVITVSGTLHTGKDFGAGYRYNVIVEEASITK